MDLPPTHLDCISAQLGAGLLLHLANIRIDEIIRAAHRLWWDSHGGTEARAIVRDGPAKTAGIVVHSHIRRLLLLGFCFFANIVRLIQFCEWT